MNHPAPPRSLAGIRILDFTRVLAGPLSTALLADLGAEVIKVEPPQGDDYRHIGPMTNGESALFTVMNRNKKSLALDLKSAQAVALVRELAARADVVVENFRPGVAERLGIGPVALMQHNPRLVYVSVSGFGQTGPLAHRPAYDIIVQAMSGLMEATGEPDGAPTLVGEAVSDVVAGLFASWAILAALLQTQRTGQGQHVDVAMFDTTLSFLATAMARYLFTGKPARRVGNRHPLSAPFGVYRARDGHFALAVLNKKLFDTLADAMAQPALADDARFATDETRSTHEPALRAAIEGWAGALSVDEVVAQLEAAGVPAAPIWNIAQALESPQAQARGLLRPVDDARLPGLRLPTQPVQFNGSAPNRTGRAPGLGEHTEPLLAELLGLHADRIAELRTLGVFGTTTLHRETGMTFLRLGVSADDQTIADAVARFATEQLAPRAQQLDEDAASATCHVPGLAALGVMGMNLPERFGGAGVTPTAMLLSLVAVSRACAATSSMIGAHYLGTDAVLIAGSDAQRADWLPRCASGEWLAGFALTEPRGGSHPADLRTQAVRESDGDSYCITGVKHFISNAAEARFLVVFAKTDAAAGARGVSAFIVPTDSHGITVSQPEKLMGIRGGHAFEVAFDNVQVPAANRLGEEGTGFKTAMKVLDNSRLDVAATALGIAEAALDAAIAWARDRQIGGEPLAGKQGIQWMLADMKLRLEASWGLTMQALALRQAGQPFTLQSAMAKLHASEMVGFVADQALQIHGGYGFTRALPLERYVRDARILRIYEGSSEIQRNIIGRLLVA